MQQKSPRLIFVNGPVAVGKSTLAQKYIDEHKLALVLNTDDFVGAMGQWLENEPTARKLALQYIVLVAEQHLKAGYDVVIPYLLAEPKDMQQIEVAAKSSAKLYEFALVAPKEEVLGRALQRGTWGEPGAPPLTEKDTPIVEDLYDKFIQALEARPKSIQIRVTEGDIAGTYEKLISYLEVGH